MTIPPDLAPDQEQAAVPPRNGLGALGFVLGLAGLALSFVPAIAVVATVVAVLGVGSAAAGLNRAKKRAAGKGLTIAGLVLSIVAIVNCHWELSLS